ncbi:Glia-derived nexin [Bagarius yarrelli]|uniref:Glia-derived nexin n=1 Tax=Bagarius yarrelli TaxID=175774 RepID=A0A556V833_BAGYA|nr:Glia-derived nexin [Bagarius yarrelli]
MIQEKPHENLVVSPYGVASILGMLLPGAHGNTKQQLLNGLRINSKGPYKMFRKMRKILTAKTNNNFITIANALFPQEGFNIRTNFLNTNRDNFLCDSHPLNYNNPQKSADFINLWMQNRTKGHIHSIINADMLDPSLTRLVVVNSIYFKGKWKSRFQVQNTKMRSFTAGDGKSYQVPMMSQLSAFNFGWANTPDGVKYRVIELPYQGNHTSMFIAFPLESVTPLSTILSHLTTKTVNGWAKLMRHGKIRLLLPKFTTQMEMDLKKPLSALGITDIFLKGKADFQHLSSEAVYLSTALQTSKIEVNEDGTKAAAATTGRARIRPVEPELVVTSVSAITAVFKPVHVLHVTPEFAYATLTKPEVAHAIASEPELTHIVPAQPKAVSRLLYLREAKQSTDDYVQNFC